MPTKNTRTGLSGFRKQKAKELVLFANQATDPFNYSITTAQDTPVLSNIVTNLQCVKARDLSENVREKVFAILKDNMQVLYSNSSWGWDDDKKWAETFSPSARILLCHIGDSKHTENEKLSGFVHFRFECEDTDPVLYCYDIQLLPDARGFGIGQHIMNILCTMASCYKMHRVLLTVFKSNERAIKFFRACGFEKDVTDPSRFKDCRAVDYLIMSKQV